MKKLAVFGNPIKQSQSPFIHAEFAKQNRMLIDYQRIFVASNKISPILINFAKNNGFGANITAPFKEQAFEFCNEISEKAKNARSVNTIKWKNEKIIGENTDGAGLIYDLKRLNFLKNKTNVLIIGAGGAAKGIIHPLLNENCEITLKNRSIFRAKEIEKQINHPNFCINPSPKNAFDLIINATSLSLIGKSPNLDDCYFHEKTVCYDLSYKKNSTEFLKLAEQKGCKNLADGIGMLVAQAAFSFNFWFDVFPDILPVLQKLKQKLHY